MSKEFVEKRVKLVNPQGLHIRPAGKFAELASRFDADVQLAKDDQSVDGKSIMSILVLGADAGTEIRILASGSDATAAVDALTELVQTGFGEDVQDGTQLAGEH